MKKVRKAVFPVAGMGTRFLPATKASPKEMLPIVQAADPVRGGEGGSGWDHRHGLRHRPFQAGDRGSFRQGL